MCWEENHSGVQAVVEDDARWRRKHWRMAWVAVEAATVTTAALSRTTTTSQPKSARVTAAIAVAAEADAMALAAEASTAVSKAMATCEGRTAILLLEKTKECRSKSRQVSCHLYLPFLLCFPSIPPVIALVETSVADNVLELRRLRVKLMFSLI